jgi:hypothetical protein
MDRTPLQTCALLLTAFVLTAGCGSSDDTPRAEVTLDDLNAALVYLEESGKDIPASVYDLTNLPALQGMVFPTLPAGQYFSIDPDRNEVIIELDHLPNMPDSFPHKGGY